MSLDAFLNKVRSDVLYYEAKDIKVTRIIVCPKGEDIIIKGILRSPVRDDATVAPLELLGIPLRSHKSMPEGWMWFQLAGGKSG